MSTKIQISANIYNGFSIDIDNKRLSNMSEKDIIDEIKNIMKVFFLLHNLYELSNGVDNLNLHIHQDIIPSEIIYVCECSNSI